MNSYRDWHLGMKVVCVDDSNFERVLSIGKIYTVTSTGPSAGWYRGEWSEGIAVELLEVTNPDDCAWNRGLHPGFNARRFRRCDPRKTDISIFTAMLNGASKKVSA